MVNCRRQLNHTLPQTNQTTSLPPSESGFGGRRREGLGESDLFPGFLDSLLIFLSSLSSFFIFSLRFLVCLYLFTSVHVLFKIPHSHDAFQAECPAAHKTNLTVEEGLPHHQHLEERGEGQSYITALMLPDLETHLSAKNNVETGKSLESLAVNDVSKENKGFYN